MKFKHAMLDMKEIERRTREEQCRTGKRVTEVILTKGEWGEFTSTLGRCDALRGYYQFHLGEPLSRVACMAGDCYPNYTVHVITIRPE